MQQTTQWSLTFSQKRRNDMKRNLGFKQTPEWLILLVTVTVSLFAVLIVVLLVTLQVWHEGKTDSAMNSSVDRHQVVAKEWLADLQHEVVEKTKDPQAETIFKMLKEKSEAVLPNDTGFSFNGKDIESKPIRILPLLPSDKQNNFPLWKRFFQSDIAAAFVSDERVIVIKEDAPTSSVFKGLILVHEGNHALRYLEHPYTERSNKVFSEEERDTHEFVARLMAKIGGAPYEHLLSSEVQRMTTTAKQTAEGMQFSPSGKYHEDLDTVFGLALSDSEKYKREKLLWLDTVFHFIDAYYDGNKDEKEGVKAEFLLSIYIAQGMREPEKT
jgi:hypothetical protein